MIEVSKTLKRKTSKIMSNATSLLVLQAGQGHLKLAQWPKGRQVWAGSCPCQPFSKVASKKTGRADDRHLWPVWFELIKKCKPSVIFGEQVAEAIAFGWLDEVQIDLESLDYAIGVAVYPVVAVGARQERERLYLIAYLDSRGLWDQSKYKWQSKTKSATHGKAQSLASINQQRPPIRNLAGQNWWEFEPDVGCVVHGFPRRVDQIRTLGNAIVPQAAAEFIKAYLEAEKG